MTSLPAGAVAADDSAPVRRCSIILPGIAAAAAGRDAGVSTAAALSAAGDVTAGRHGGAASSK